MSAGFLAHIVVAKFLLGLPINRVCAAFTKQGANFAPSTPVGALRSLNPLLAPLWDAIREHNALSPHLYMDETSLEGLRGHCRQGAVIAGGIWIFVGHDTTAFVIKPGRGADVAAKHLGIDLNAETPMLTRARQHCSPLVTGTSGSKEEALAFIKVRAVIDRIDATRIAQSADPDLFAAAKKVLATLNHEWDGLVAFLEYPDVGLENNAAERGLRRPVVIRKACYGSGSIWSAEFAANERSNLVTATQNHLNPLVYLKAYLNACAEAGGKAPQGATLERFFPWAASEADQAAWADTS
ncbi:MAG: IS66 family transposase [Ferrimicrobium sp.]